ncbi:MAG TPA: hypothetical protein ENN99_16075 [Chloroflexi bacterium]|nr:hypothetical protein [Chloroflexota bacterium]
MNTDSQSAPYQVCITRREMGWVALVSVTLLAVTSLPYLVGWWMDAHDAAHVFGGFIYAVEDGNSYLAKMQVGAAGHWLFYLAYTPEPHQGELFFLYYILLGKLSRLLGLSMLTGLHLSRILTVPFGLFCYYRFIAYWTFDCAVRRWGLALFAFTAGLGWLWVVLGGGSTLGAMPVDLWVPDASYFFSALLFPHLPLAQGLLLWFVTDALEFLAVGRVRSGAMAALVGLLVSLIHPYTLPVIGVVVGLFAAWQVLRRRWLFWPTVGRLAAAMAPTIPYLAYNGFVFWNNPAFQSWREQSQTVSPAPVHYLLGLGFILIWAVVGIARRRTCEGRPLDFLIVWAAAVPILIYLPSSIQRRFLDGYQAPLTVLAACGLRSVFSDLRRPQVRRLAPGLVVGLMMLTNLLLIVGALAVLPGRDEPLFRPGAEQAAADWLARRAQGEVVLSGYESGNYLPTRGAMRVFLGHRPETMRSAEKRDLVASFFSGETDDAWRQRLLAKYDVRWVWWGPWERALGPFDPGTCEYLDPAYDVGGYAVFEVVR